MFARLSSLVLTVVTNALKRHEAPSSPVFQCVVLRFQSLQHTIASFLHINSQLKPFVCSSNSSDEFEEICVLRCQKEILMESNSAEIL